jgi:hypothetical protein
LIKKNGAAVLSSELVQAEAGSRKNPLSPSRLIITHKWGEVGRPMRNIKQFPGLIPPLTLPSPPRGGRGKLLIYPQDTNLWVMISPPLGEEGIK